MSDKTAPQQRANNIVYLRGRLADAPVERDLPSGDILLSFRLTVGRPSDDRVRVDSLECVTVRVGLRRIVMRAAPGDELEVEGSLQRRFWRAPTGAASRYSVSVDAVRRVKSGAATSNPVRSSSARNP